MIKFNTLEQLVDGIKVLKTVNLDIDYSVTYDRDDYPESLIYDVLLREQHNMNNVEYVLDDMKNKDYSCYGELIEFLLYSCVDIKPINNYILKNILDRYFQNRVFDTFNRTVLSNCISKREMNFS